MTPFRAPSPLVLRRPAFSIARRVRARSADPKLFLLSSNSGPNKNTHEARAQWASCAGDINVICRLSSPTECCAAEHISISGLIGQRGASFTFAIGSTREVFVPSSTTHHGQSCGDAASRRLECNVCARTFVRLQLAVRRPNSVGGIGVDGCRGG